MEVGVMLCWSNLPDVERVFNKKPRLITAGATTKKLSYENKNFLCRNWKGKTGLA